MKILLVLTAHALLGDTGRFRRRNQRFARATGLKLSTTRNSADAGHPELARQTFGPPGEADAWTANKITREALT